MTSTERARTIVDSWNDVLRRELPEDARLFDAHTHLGNDIDGMVGDYDELTSILDQYGFTDAFVFCMDEHDREPRSACRMTARWLTRSARAGPSSRSSASI